jgi:Tol biopolymer transport system component
MRISLEGALPSALATVALVACGGRTGGQDGGCGGAGCGASPRQMIFMMPANHSVLPPGTSNLPGEIVMMSLDGSGRRQLTNDGKFKFLPHFSPDGSRINKKFAVGGYGDAKAQTDVFAFDLANALETQLTHTGVGIQGVWSPDDERIVYGSYKDNALWVMNADGSNPQLVGQASGPSNDLLWADFAWSGSNWIVCTVAQSTNNCFQARLDKIRPDGSARPQVTDGGQNCTPTGSEPSGDADPGFSPDGQTIFSSRGFPATPAGASSGTARTLYSFTSEAWSQGKPEADLSLPSKPSCVEGVAKASPDGTQMLLFRLCFDRSSPMGGIYITDTGVSYRTFVTQGFGADWNPAWKP